MLNKKANQGTTLTADLLHSAMKAQNLSINDVAKKVDVSYEYIRNILKNGKLVPSAYLIGALSEALKINLGELQRAAVADRIRIKFGSSALELQGKNPELEPIERVWHKLSKQHKADIVIMAQTFAQSDVG